MQNASLFRPLSIYFGLMILAQAIIGGIGLAFPEFTVPSFVNFLIVIFAAIAAGRSFGAAARRMPTGGERFTFGILGTALSMAINFAFLAGILVYYGFPVTGENLGLLLTGDAVEPGDMAGFLTVVFGLAIVIGVGLCYAGLGTGAKQALKKAEAAV